VSVAVCLWCVSGLCVSVCVCVFICMCLCVCVCVFRFTSAKLTCEYSKFRSWSVSQPGERSCRQDGPHQPTLHVCVFVVCAGVVVVLCACLSCVCGVCVCVCICVSDVCLSVWRFKTPESRIANLHYRF
jgi:hypothetical protein